MRPGAQGINQDSLVAGFERKLALLALLGLFAAGGAYAVPVSIEPAAVFELEPGEPAFSTRTGVIYGLDTVELDMGTSGDGPATELALQGTSYVDRDIAVAVVALPVEPVTGCTVAEACQAVAVTEPGAWLLLIAGLLGLGNCGAFFCSISGLQAIAGVNIRGSKRPASAALSCSTSIAASLQVPQLVATPRCICRPPRSDTPDRAALRICLSVIPLQIQTYIRFNDLLRWR